MNSGLYFYNRSDYPEIFKTISPLRPKIESFIIRLQYCGLVTNLLCAFVLIQKSILYRKSIIFLLFLAISDFLYNLMWLLPNILRDLKIVDYDIFKISNLSCFFFDLRTTTFHFYSVVLTLYVTIDRFNHIHKPLKFNRSLNTFSKQIMMGFLLFLISFVIALPHGFLMVYNDAEKDCDGREFFKKKLYDTNASLTYYQVYFTLTEPSIIWFIPGILILFLNAYVIYKIFKSNKLSSKKFGPNFLTRMTSSIKLKSKKSVNPNQTDSTKIVKEKSSNNTLLQIPKTKSIDIQLRSENNLKLKNASFNGKPSSSKSFCFNNLSTPSYNSTHLKKSSSWLSLDENQNNQTIIQTSVKQDSKPFTSLFQKSANSMTSRISTQKTNSFNKNNAKINVNQISHYVTIIALGFYFILSTIPYGILLSYQNNLTLRLNYYLMEKNDYLTDPIWLKFGNFREFTVVAKMFFVSNHVINFFFYLLFNRMFRIILFELLQKLFMPIRYLFYKIKQETCYKCATN